jgi:hypothetical protein
MYPFAHTSKDKILVKKLTKPELQLAKELRCVVTGWKEENWRLRVVLQAMEKARPCWGRLILPLPSERQRDR